MLTGRDMGLPRHFAPRNEPAVTTQMQRNRLASLREKMSIKIELIIGEQYFLMITEKNRVNL